MQFEINNQKVLINNQKLKLKLKPEAKRYKQKASQQRYKTQIPAYPGLAKFKIGLLATRSSAFVTKLNPDIDEMLQKNC